MRASNIIGICHLGTIVTAAAAFQPIAPVPSLQQRPSTIHQQQSPVTPLSSSAVDAEVLTEAQELLNEQFYTNNDLIPTGGTNDAPKLKTIEPPKNSVLPVVPTPAVVAHQSGKRRIRLKRSMMIYEVSTEAECTEESSACGTLSSASFAAAETPHHPGMMPPPPPMEFEFDDFGGEFGDGPFFDMPPPPHHHHHQYPHMMPPMDMPPPHFFGHDGPMDGGPMFMSENSMDEEENYVDRVDFADHGRPVNDRIILVRGQQQQQRGGGRRGGPSEFAEAGTQSAMRKYPQSGPAGPMPPQYREEGYLGDSTLKEISMDYGIPITYLADVLATWGCPFLLIRMDVFEGGAEAELLDALAGDGGMF
ncbi:hypothetical protein QTG54_004920 [Skeletonema marinoi]|uniref:Uncharacterized protein n=1 Tax=Skeletonema marinoi TaxID=267567 RepID=A0AAD9DEM2_9STRA|nr:hypothetical protein QTG54_004920 [Skeletonema marinoi]